MGKSKMYTGSFLDQVAFPLGGLGAGMFCVEGTGSLGSFSLRNEPDLFFEPNLFSAVCVREETENTARVLEGPVPRRKVFGGQGTLSGLGVNENFGKSYGLPRFSGNTFEAAFPFARLAFEEEGFPLKVSLEAFSPFLPLREDDSSLPAATLCYTFENITQREVEAVYSFHTFQFMTPREEKWFPRPVSEKSGGQIEVRKDGVLLRQPGSAEHPEQLGECRISVPLEGARVNADWFRGGWFDTLSMLWKDIAAGVERESAARDGTSAGASISLSFSLKPGEKKQVPLLFTWYVPNTALRLGDEDETLPDRERETYRPWYARRFSGADDVMEYYLREQERLYGESRAFSEALYQSSLPGEAFDALASNLAILKSPTVLRQTDGRLWQWEGCCDTVGSCHGSCTHVWNYAQAICHLFPRLERGLRYTEFHEDQDERGHQEFRTALPIRNSHNKFHAASDGQLGGLMKMYREWRILGDDSFLVDNWPRMAASLNYCISTWDKKHEGVLKEPHHNTYDIEFWGADGMCSSFYLGALKAMCLMGERIRQDVSLYGTLYQKGRAYLEGTLYNGEYFVQQVEWKTLEAEWDLSREPESSRCLIQREGPKYQYGAGCISDGVLGAWMAQVCGLGDILDPEKVKSHLLSVYRYNFKKDLSAHANPQRPGYALGKEGGLLLCTWPKGGRPSLPFVYSDEVWTGIEHQVASHLMMFGCMKEAMDIIAASRERYDGRKRNPFDEYECGHFYARALASYSYLQAYTGVRYDAVDKTLYYSAKNCGDYRVFLCGEKGYGVFRLKDGGPSFEPVRGELEISAYRCID